MPEKGRSDTRIVKVRRGRKTYEIPVNQDGFVPLLALIERFQEVDTIRGGRRHIFSHSRTAKRGISPPKMFSGNWNNVLVLRFHSFGPDTDGVRSVGSLAIVVLFSIYFDVCSSTALYTCKTHAHMSR